MKKTKFMLSAALALTMAAGMTAGAAGTTAKTMSNNVFVDGKANDFTAYNIADYNYFKLRDIAAAINGSEKQFEVTWDSAKNAINLITEQAYSVAGGELTPPSSMANAIATPTSSTVYIDGKPQSFTAYNIGGFNYFKLRDVCAALDIGCEWDAAAGAIQLSTTEAYEAPAEQPVEQPAEKPTEKLPSPEIDQEIVEPQGKNMQDIDIFGKVTYYVPFVDADGNNSATEEPAVGAILKFYEDRNRERFIGWTKTDEEGNYRITVKWDYTLDEHLEYNDDAYVDVFFIDETGKKYSNVSAKSPALVVDYIAKQSPLNVEGRGGILCDFTARNSASTFTDF